MCTSRRLSSFSFDLCVCAPADTLVLAPQPPDLWCEYDDGRPGYRERLRASYLNSRVSVWVQTSCRVENMHRITRNTKAVAPLLMKLKKRERKDRCLVCGERMRLTLQKHHIDRNSSNNRPENVCFLCGSCHSITFSRASKEEAIKTLETRNQNSKRAKKAWRHKRKKGKMWADPTDRRPRGIKTRR